MANQGTKPKNGAGTKIPVAKKFLRGIRANPMERAIALSFSGMRKGQGGPFGAVVVKDGKIIGEGCNQVLASGDPTAHAEVVAIRAACARLGNFSLEGCDLYTSCEPCPMCLGAAHWARVRRIVYGNTRKDAAAIGFDDAFIYSEIRKPLTKRKIPMVRASAEEASEAFSEWRGMPGKQPY